MRRWLTSLLLPLFILSGAPVAHAQEAEAEYFASIDGLERVVARSFMAPMTDDAVSTGSTTGEAGTPAATAQSDSHPSGTVLLSIFVYEFDSPDNAAMSFEAFDADLQGISERDLRAPMTADLPLEDIGDQAKGYIGEFNIEGTTLITTFATVQDGNYVYSLMGQFVNMDGQEQTQVVVQALTDAEAGSGDGTYREDGTSTGGLWDTFMLLDPDLAEGSTTTDLQIYPLYPQPEGTSPAGTASAIEVETSDVHNLSELDGIRDAYGMTWLSPDSASDQSGVFRIESWILPFDAEEDASQAVNPLSATLTQPIDVNARSNQNVNVNGMILTTSVSAGPIRDESLPAGNAVVNIQQRESTVYAVIVYAIDEDPAPVAEAIIEQIIATPASEEPADLQAGNGPTGGVWARFPEAGDPVVDALIPAEYMQPEID